MKSLEKGVIAAACLVLAAGCTEDRSETGPGGVAGVADENVIVAMVERRIEDDAALGSQEIEVEAEGTVVTLSGRVENGVQKQKAEQVAEQVEGVERVDNEIVIAPTSPVIPPPEEPGMPPPGSGAMPPAP